MDVTKKLKNYICEGTIESESDSSGLNGVIHTTVCRTSASTVFLRAYNNAISCIRLLVENYFGRMNVLFSICSEKYNLDLGYYDFICKYAVSLTNYHIKLHPLRTFPFQLFSLGNHSTLGIDLSYIKRLKIPVQCFDIIGSLRIENSEENESRSIGEIFKQSILK